MKPSMTGLGKRLKQARQEQRLSGSELAARLGLERSAIPQYESERTGPSLAVLRKLATILRVSLDWLVFGEEASQPGYRDRELADYFTKIDQLDSRERSLVKVFLDSVLAREELEEFRRAARKKDKAA